MAAGIPLSSAHALDEHAPRFVATIYCKVRASVYTDCVPTDSGLQLVMDTTLPTTFLNLYCNKLLNNLLDVGKPDRFSITIEASSGAHAYCSYLP